MTPRKELRNLRITKQYESGVTLAAIARYHNLTPQRINSILKSYCPDYIPAPKGGQKGQKPKKKKPVILHSKYADRIWQQLGVRFS